MEAIYASGGSNQTKMGLKCYSFLASRSRDRGFKSDQNGIEIRLLQFVRPKLIHVQIRPKWD